MLRETPHSLDVPQVTQRGCTSCSRKRREALGEFAYKAHIPAWLDMSAEAAHQGFQAGLSLLQFRSRLFAGGQRKHPCRQGAFRPRPPPTLPSIDHSDLGATDKDWTTGHWTRA